MSPETRLFTPYLMNGQTYDGETMGDGRALMKITFEDAHKYDGAQPDDRRTGPVFVEITDLETQTKWLVRPAICSGDCFCAAEAKRVS